MFCVRAKWMIPNETLTFFCFYKAIYAIKYTLTKLRKQKAGNAELTKFTGLSCFTLQNIKKLQRSLKFI